MATNNILTISMITRESLRVLSNSLTFTRHVNRQYDDQFERKGAKIGATINIRKPARYVGRTGPVVSIEAQNETYVPLTLNKQFGVDVDFTSTELALSMDDFSDRVIKPAMTRIANQIDFDGMALLSQVYNQVGAPGSAVTALSTYLAAGVKLDRNLAPRDGLRKLVADPSTEATATSLGLTLFNPTSEISEQYKRGELREALGFGWNMDQNAPVHTNGTWAGALTVNADVTAGNTMQINDAGTGLALNVGDVFTVGTGATGVYTVNAQTKALTQDLQQFVVSSVVSGTGADQVITFSPAVVLTGSLQNVDKKMGAGVTVTMSGATGVTTQLSVAFHRDAFVLGTAELQLPGGVDMASIASDPETGLSIRFIRAFDVRTDQWISRFDVLYGWATLYEQLACRIATS